VEYYADASCNIQISFFNDTWSYGPLVPSQVTTLTAISGSGTYGGTATLTATLKAGTPVSGKTVTFTLNGASFANNTATTDGSGVATLNNVSLVGIGAGTYPTGVLASFAGDSGYAGNAGQASLTVSKADQAIVITQSAPATAAVDDQFTVSATGGGSGAGGGVSASGCGGASMISIPALRGCGNGTGGSWAANRIRSANTPPCPRIDATSGSRTELTAAWLPRRAVTPL
jgi:hypothetical protein